MSLHYGVVMQEGLTWTWLSSHWKMAELGSFSELTRFSSTCVQAAALIRSFIQVHPSRSGLILWSQQHAAHAPLPAVDAKQHGQQHRGVDQNR
jgi:hypothetical protein